MKKKHLSPHDRYVRSILNDKNVAREFIETHLPSRVLKGVDLLSLEIQKDSFIDDKLHLQIADILYKVKFYGEVGYIYVLIEHASTPDLLLPFRMVKYMISIMDAHLNRTKEKRLPFVYPLIFYSGKRPYTPSTDFFSLFGQIGGLVRSLFLKPFQLIDLGRISDKVLKDLFWFRAAGLILKHIKDANLLPILGSVLSYLREIEKVGDVSYIDVTLSYIVEAGDIQDKQAFIETVITNLETVDEDKIMTLAEQWKLEGYQNGIEKGIEKGILQGMEKGKIERDIEMARTLLAKGMSLEFISSVTELSEEELKDLASHKKAMN